MPKEGLTFKERILAKAVEIQMGKPMIPPIIAPVKKPREKSKIALVTTGGIHLKNQTPFVPENGDPTFRVIPHGTGQSDLTVTHGHYDETEVRKDVNCLLPMDRLQELVDQGFVSAAASNHISFMGYIPDVKQLVRETAPEATRMLVADHVDIAVITPG